MPVVADMAAVFYTEDSLEMTEMLWFTGGPDYSGSPAAFRTQLSQLQANLQLCNLRTAGLIVVELEIVLAVGMEFHSEL